MKTDARKVNRLFVVISVYLFLLFLISVIISYQKQQNKNIKPAEICSFAKQFLNDSYLIEVGRDLDCSGFTRYVYKKYGYKIPRSALQQFRRYAVSNRKPKPGDLLFFSSEDKKVGHVGIYLGKNKFIHTPGKNREVVIDDISKNYWKIRYLGAGNVIKEE